MKDFKLSARARELYEAGYEDPARSEYALYRACNPRKKLPAWGIWLRNNPRGRG